MLHYVLGTDIGTGSIKAVAIGLDGDYIDSEQREYEGGAITEQDPELLFSVWMQAVSALVRRMGSAPKCISFSSAMHGVMLVDAKARPVSPLITWSDLRAAAVATALRNSSKGKVIYEHTGTPIHAMSPLCKIKWLGKNEEGLFQRAHRFIGIKEYIWNRLFDEFVVDHSIASATGLFDIEKKNWYAPALSWAGIKREQLSRPVSTTYTQTGCDPELAQQLSIGRDTVFCIGASDGCLANLGAHALQPGVAALTIGTSGAVRIAATQPLRNWKTMPFSYLLDESTFICGGPVNNGGNIVQWLLKKFCPNAETGYHGLFEAAQKVRAGAEGLVFLPYLFGERAPVWDEQGCGVYFGIGPQHGHEHFLRAALEGICFSLRQIIILLEEVSPIGQLHVSGGFVQSPFWLQLLADITNKNIWVPPNADASATGAAYLGLKAIDHWDESLVQSPGSGNYMYPREPEAYEKNFATFQKLYPALQGLMNERNY